MRYSSTIVSVFVLVSLSVVSSFVLPVKRTFGVDPAKAETIDVPDYSPIALGDVVKKKKGFSTGGLSVRVGGNTGGGIRDGITDIQAGGKGKPHGYDEGLGIDPSSKTGGKANSNRKSDPPTKNN